MTSFWRIVTSPDRYQNYRLSSRHVVSDVLTVLRPVLRTLNCNFALDYIFVHFSRIEFVLCAYFSTFLNNTTTICSHNFTLSHHSSMSRTKNLRLFLCFLLVATAVSDSNIDQVCDFSVAKKSLEARDYSQVILLLGSHGIAQNNQRRISDDWMISGAILSM